MSVNQKLSMRLAQNDGKLSLRLQLIGDESQPTTRPTMPARDRGLHQRRREELSTNQRRPHDHCIK